MTRIEEIEQRYGVDTSDWGPSKGVDDIRFLLGELNRAKNRVVENQDYVTHLQNRVKVLEELAAAGGDDVNV